MTQQIKIFNRTCIIILTFILMSSIKVSADENEIEIIDDCHLHAFYFENNQGIYQYGDSIFIDHDLFEMTKAINSNKNFKVEIKNDVFKKITSSKMHLNIVFNEINKALKKNVTDDKYYKSMHVADSGQLFKITSSLMKIDDKAYNILEVINAQDALILGIAIICMKQPNDTVSLALSSIDVDTNDIKLAMTQHIFDLGWIPKVEYDIRLKEIRTNKFTITKQLEAIRKLAVSKTISCEQKVKRYYELLKISYSKAYDCKIKRPIYNGPVVTGYLP